jgi:glutathione S-transferase
MITLFTFGPYFGLPDPSPFVTKAEVLLKMADVPYRTQQGGFRKAPKGKLPYIEDAGRLIGDSTFIRWHLEKTYGIDFDKGLSAPERATAWAFEKMCEEHLYWAVLESRWMDDKNFDRGPRRFFDVAPAPVRPLIVALIRRQVHRTLKGQGFGRHSRAEIEELAARDLDALAAYLGEKTYLMGDDPCGADATVFAFVAGMLCPLFETPIHDSAERHANLVAYRDRGMAKWFPELAQPTAKQA